MVQGEDASVAFDKYQSELWPNCQALWKIWVPGQLLNFAIMPAHLQIPTAAGISFVWTIILSMMRGSTESEGEEEPSPSKVCCYLASHCCCLALAVLTVS